jgi:hypothetical protein
LFPNNFLDNFQFATGTCSVQLLTNQLNIIKDRNRIGAVANDKNMKVHRGLLWNLPCKAGFTPSRGLKFTLGHCQSIGYLDRLAEVGLVPQQTTMNLFWIVHNFIRKALHN